MQYILPVFNGNGIGDEFLGLEPDEKRGTLPRSDALAGEQSGLEAQGEGTLQLGHGLLANGSRQKRSKSDWLRGQSASSHIWG